MKPEDITQEGWYYDPEDNGFVEVYRKRAIGPKMIDGFPSYEFEEVGPVILLCDGMPLRQDWPAEMRGPVVIPDS